MFQELVYMLYVELLAMLLFYVKLLKNESGDWSANGRHTVRPCFLELDEFEVQLSYLKVWLKDFPQLIVWHESEALAVLQFSGRKANFWPFQVTFSLPLAKVPFRISALYL